MGQNVEIKARLSSEEIERVRSYAMARASAPPRILAQVDTFYHCRNGRLKLRVLDDGSSELIAYQRPNQAAPKLSSYVRYPSNDAETLHEALAGSLGVRGVVKKQRELIMIGQTRVHLDTVDRLGQFVELEVVLREGQSAEDGQQIAAALMNGMGIQHDSLIQDAYIDLLDRPDSV